MNKPVAFCLLLAVLLVGCSRNSSVVDESCGNTVQINSMVYNNPGAFKAVINEASIEGACLIIKISGSGCSEAALDNDLVAEEGILKTLPPQRNIKVALRMKGSGTCGAYFTKTFRYNISPLKVEGYKKLLLNLDGYSGALTYSY